MIILWGKYLDGAWEEIGEAETPEEMNDLYANYSMAFGKGWTWKII